MKRIRELKEEIRRNYKEENIDYILTEILNVSLKDLYIKDIFISSEREKEIKGVFEKIKKGFPLPYILKKTYFYNMELFIEEGVFIPRPETELFAVETAKFLREISFYPSNILDLGCGSGCIALLMKKFFPQSNVFASDISIKACRVSKINSFKTGIKINVVCTDLFSSFKNEFDLIISNPPYVKEEEFKNLSEEVKREPRMALYGGKDGLEFYERISREIKDVLKKNGILAIEIHPFLENEIKEIFKDFKILKEIPDLNGFKRGLILSKFYRF